MTPLDDRQLWCLLAEEMGRAAWLEGFSMVIRTPQFGSVCIYIYFLLFGTGADVSLLKHFTSDLYHSLYVLILNYAVNMLE